MLKFHLHVSTVHRFPPSQYNLNNAFSASYANMTEKQPCTFELSTYDGISAAGVGFTNNIVRDNCQTALYFCNTATKVCEPLRLVGQQCQYHRDCQSVGLDFPWMTLRLKRATGNSTIASRTYALAHRKNPSK